jgi:pyrroloquinoline quinone biosynthesis protein B
VSSDGRAWFLLNASPDIRVQVNTFPPLLLREAVRGTGVEGVLLTCADLDHTLGLFLLREGKRLAVHATPAIRSALDDGLRLSEVLNCYCGIDWHPPPGELSPLRTANGAASGLLYAAFSVAGRPPRYREAHAPRSGDVIGYRIEDVQTRKRLVYVPGLAALDPDFIAHAETCDLLILDGTFWSDDEMVRTGVGTSSARAMGHLPIGGHGGTLEFVTSLPAGRTIYVHVNNTNPVLRDDSPHGRDVIAAGAAIGYDGQEFIL